MEESVVEKLQRRLWRSCVERHLGDGSVASLGKISTKRHCGEAVKVARKSVVESESFAKLWEACGIRVPKGPTFGRSVEMRKCFSCCATWR